MNPPGRGRVSGSPAEWLLHANSDLSLARLAQGHAEILPELICFHTQQAVEKALKAVLLASGVDFPLVHDIDELLEIAQQGGTVVPPQFADAGSLTPYAVGLRYPAEVESISADEVEEAIRLAEQFVLWARTTVQA
jgi:HEPN domain-containing protein